MVRKSHASGAAQGPKANGVRPGIGEAIDRGAEGTSVARAQLKASNPEVSNRPRESPRLRAVARAVGVVLALWALGAAWLLGTAWYSVRRFEPRVVPPEVASIGSREDYAARMDSHARPYVYECVAAGAGRVLVFGAEHTRDPDDPQLDGIRRRWEGLRPTVALIEGDLGMLFPAFMDPVRTFGETGFVHGLARADSIPTYSWEPPVELVLQGALDQGFSREQVALRWILNPYFSSLRHGRPADPEALVRDTFEERARAAPIAGCFTNLAQVEGAWGLAFPGGPDWRDVSDQFGLPGFLGAMDLNLPRDVHLVACIRELVSAGERVFVVCGSSHAVKIEPALEALFE